MNKINKWRSAALQDIGWVHNVVWVVRAICSCTFF